MGALFSGRSASRTVGLAAAAIVALGLLGCAADRPKPTTLEAVTAQIAGKQVWSARLDSVQFPLAVATPGESFVVAGTDGTVLSIEAQTGRELWRGSAGDKLSAGVGSDGRFAAVVTRDNQLVVLDKGAKVWSTRLASRTSTAPLVAGGGGLYVESPQPMTEADLPAGFALLRQGRAGTVHYHLLRRNS